MTKKILVSNSFYHFLFAVSLGNKAFKMSEKCRLGRKIGFQNTFYTKNINVIIDSIGPSIILRSIFRTLCFRIYTLMQLLCDRFCFCHRFLPSVRSSVRHNFVRTVVKLNSDSLICRPLLVVLGNNKG